MAVRESDARDTRPWIRCPSCGYLARPVSGFCPHCLANLGLPPRRAVARRPPWLLLAALAVLLSGAIVAVAATRLAPGRAADAPGRADEGSAAVSASPVPAATAPSASAQAASAPSASASALVVVPSDTPVALPSARLAPGPLAREPLAPEAPLLASPDTSTLASEVWIAETIDAVERIVSGAR